MARRAGFGLDAPMPEVKRIKVRATLESEVMLFTEREVPRAIDGVAAKLTSTGLTIVSMEPEEVITAPAGIPAGYDE